MLNFIENILECAFAYGLPIIIAFIGVAALIVFLFGVFNTRTKKLPQKIFFAGIMVICTAGFFMHWLPELQSQEPVVETYRGNLLVSSTIASLIFLVAVFLARILEFVGVPFIVTFIVYLGILIFGF